MKYITGFIREQSGDSPCDSVLAELTFLFPGQTAYIFLRFWQTTDDSLHENVIFLFQSWILLSFLKALWARSMGGFLSHMTLKAGNLSPSRSRCTTEGLGHMGILHTDGSLAHCPPEFPLLRGG